MPIHVRAEIRRMDDEEFKARAYEVMRLAFDVQRELGRLLHEKIYQREIAFRVPDAQCEVAIDVQFEDFCKTYYLDLLVGGGAIFELKAVEALVDRHRRQFWDVGLKITAMTTEGQAEFHSHLDRLLAHADLRAIQWINITRPLVRFKTLRKHGRDGNG